MIMNKKYPGLLVTPADKEQALYSGLMGLGSQLAQGYTKQPSSFLQRFTQGGQAFQKAYGDKIATTKAEQLQNMQAQAAQASLAEQQRKIQAAADQKKAREAFFNIPRTGTYSPNMMGGMEQTDDMGNVTNTMSQAEKENLFAQAFPDEYAKQKAQALLPTTALTGRPAADIQKYLFRQKLIRQYGEDSTQVKSFDEIEGMDFKNLGYLAQVARIGPTGKAGVEMNVQALNQADAAMGSYEKATSLLKDLENPNYKFESGAAADLRLGVLKLRELVDSDPELRERIMNTEFMTSRMGSEVFGMIKALGIGARGLDTPAEREFMQEVLTGKVSLNRDTLIKMAKLRQQTSRDRIRKFYDRTKSGAFDDIFAETGRTRGEFNLGKANLKAKRVKINEKGEVVK